MGKKSSSAFYYPGPICGVKNTNTFLHKLFPTKKLMHKLKVRRKKFKPKKLLNTTPTPTPPPPPQKLIVCPLVLELM